MNKTIQVDSRDMKMPSPMIAFAKSYKRARQGDIIELVANDSEIESRINHWCKRTGNKLLRMERSSRGVYVVEIQVTAKGKVPNNNQESVKTLTSSAIP